MIKTSVSPFWKENELRYPLKLKNWHFKQKSRFPGAQLTESSEFLRKFAHILRGFSPVKIKFSKFSQFFSWPIIPVSIMGYFIFSTELVLPQ
jgi:hypothetical protein